MWRREEKRRTARLLTSGMLAGDYRAFRARVAASSEVPSDVSAVTERRDVTPSEGHVSEAPRWVRCVGGGEDIDMSDRPS